MCPGRVCTGAFRLLCSLLFTDFCQQSATVSPVVCAYLFDNHVGYFRVLIQDSLQSACYLLHNLGFLFPGGATFSQFNVYERHGLLLFASQFIGFDRLILPGFLFGIITIKDSRRLWKFNEPKKANILRSKYDSVYDSVSESELEGLSLICFG